MSRVYEGATQQAFDECVDYYLGLGYVRFESDTQGTTLRLINEDNIDLSTYVAIWRSPRLGSPGFKVFSEEF